MAENRYAQGQRFDMVFEGGGAKGMVFVGAQKAFEDRGYLPARLIGTSAGAITATLLAAGYDAEKMQAALQEKKDGKPVFATFMDEPKEEDFTQNDIDNSLTMDIFRVIDLPYVPDGWEGVIDKKIIEQLMKIKAYRVLFSFIERGGLYAGNAFLAWFRGKLEEAQPGYGTMTLKQFNTATGRDLSMVASNTTAREMLVLNHRTAPDCPVAWAVRMSMSIPFAWQEVRWQQDWGTYCGKDFSGNTVVDGGVLSNFPINLLTSDEPEVKEVMGDDANPNDYPTVGMLIDETLAVNNAPSAPANDGEEDGIGADIKKLRTVSRVSRLVNTMMHAHDNEIIGVHEKQICRLPARTYGTMEFDMTEPRRKALVAAGEAAMNKYLDNL